jgi:hypothetical protein
LRIYTDCLFSNVPLPETFDFTQTDLRNRLVPECWDRR